MFVNVNPRTVFFLQQTLYFTAFIATVEKIITYALGEHDPGAAQDWRTLNGFCSSNKTFSTDKRLSCAKALSIDETLSTDKRLSCAKTLSIDKKVIQPEKLVTFCMWPMSMFFSHFTKTKIQSTLEPVSFLYFGFSPLFPHAEGVDELVCMKKL